MATYHINPATGNPNQCTAKKQCPFGGHGEHFVSKEAARDAYELIMTAPEEDLTGLQQKMRKKFNGERPPLSEREINLRDYYQSFGLMARNQYSKWDKMGLSNEEINERIFNDLMSTTRYAAPTLKSIGWSAKDFNKEPVRVQELTVNEDDVKKIVDKLAERKFFYNDRQKEEQLHRLLTEPGEHWFSNGAAELKIFNNTNQLGGGFRVSNSRNIQSPHIDDIFMID